MYKLIANKFKLTKSLEWQSKPTNRKETKSSKGDITMVKIELGQSTLKLSLGHMTNM